MRNLIHLFVSGVLTVAGAALFVGCDNKEKVVDIETPKTSVEVERDKDTGEVEVEVEKKK